MKRLEPAGLFALIASLSLIALPNQTIAAPRASPGTLVDQGAITIRTEVGLLEQLARALNTYANLLLVLVTAAVAFANILLVIVTARYVKLTSSMLGETRRARERQAIPFVSVLPAGGSRDQFNFTLKNDGNSVAISLAAHLVNPKIPVQKNQEGQWLKLPGSIVPLAERGALSPGESFVVAVNLAYADRSPFMIRVLYANAYGQRFEMRQPFERSHDGFPARALEMELFVDGQQVAGGVIPMEALEPPEYVPPELVHPKV